MATDKVKYAQFVKKRSEWVECIGGKDPHSIMNQVSGMIWNAAVFRIVNEARRIAPAAKEGGVELNGDIHRMIDHGFFFSQMTAIRRLQDGFKMEGDRGVYSITALLRDMKANVALLTREYLLEVDGLPPNSDEIAGKEKLLIAEKMQAGEKVFFMPQLNSSSCNLRYEEIDRLTGARPENRKPADTVRLVVLQELEQKVIGACAEISKYVDKFIAHAATPFSRQTVSAKALSPTLGHLWDAHKAICEVANFIDMYLLTRTSHGFLATPQYDQFAYIDRPLAAGNQINDLQRVWEQFAKEQYAWAQYGLQELEQDLNRRSQSPLP